MTGTDQTGGTGTGDDGGDDRRVGPDAAGGGPTQSDDAAFPDRRSDRDAAWPDPDGPQTARTEDPGSGAADPSADASAEQTAEPVADDAASEAAAGPRGPQSLPGTGWDPHTPVDGAEPPSNGVSRHGQGGQTNGVSRNGTSRSGADARRPGPPARPSAPGSGAAGPPPPGSRVSGSMPPGGLFAPSGPRDGGAAGPGDAGRRGPSGPMHRSSMMGGPGGPGTGVPGYGGPVDGRGANEMSGNDDPAGGTPPNRARTDGGPASGEDPGVARADGDGRRGPAEGATGDPAADTGPQRPADGAPQHGDADAVGEAGWLPTFGMPRPEGFTAHGGPVGRTDVPPSGGAGPQGDNPLFDEGQPGWQQPGPAPSGPAPSGPASSGPAPSGGHGELRRATGSSGLPRRRPTQQGRSGVGRVAGAEPFAEFGVERSSSDVSPFDDSATEVSADAGAAPFEPGPPPGGPGRPVHPGQPGTPPHRAGQDRTVPMPSGPGQPMTNRPAPGPPGRPVPQHAPGPRDPAGPQRPAAFTAPGVPTGPPTGPPGGVGRPGGPGRPGDPASTAAPGDRDPQATRSFPPATTRPAGEQRPVPAAGALSVVVAGGGSAGHIEPALAVADAIRRLVPGARVTALGTEKGLDTQLIPARGYPLELIPPVPLPRKPSVELFKLPGAVISAVKRVREVLESVEADVVIGFGGFVSLPAYLGARGRVPIVVHEANARAGLANKVGARFAAAVCTAVPGTGLAQENVVGMPLRRSITTLDRAALRPEARTYFNLRPHGPVLLVFGGSQGARTLNEAVVEALPALTERGVSVLHAYGKNGTPAAPRPGYVPMPYIDRMDLAYAASDAVLGRAGMTTVAELTAVGLPAVYVPLPHGNGEQALNAQPVVQAGGGKLVADEELNGVRALDELIPILTDPELALTMGHRARAAGHGEADEKIARVVMEVARR